MERGAAPWRVLGSDETAGSGANKPGRDADALAGGGAGRGRAGGPAGFERDRPVRHHARPSAGVIAVFVVAGALGIGGLLMVASGPAPTVLVDTADAGLAGLASPGAAGSGRVTTGDPGAAGTIVVEVAGAVARPGLYHLPGGSRVADALAAAGGYGPRVDATAASLTLDLAARLADGAKVRVPSRDDPTTAVGHGPGDAGGAVGPAATVGGDPGGAGSGGQGTGGQGTAGLVDLNHATEGQLDALPGVGPATVAKIVAAREERPFGAIGELRDRKIVGAATFEKLKALVTVR